MPGSMTLTSTAFQSGGPIPDHHTCTGQDVSPPLAWSGVPEGVAAFALVVDDRDARGFIHWVVAELPGDASSLSEGVPSSGPGAPPQGRNDFGRVGWGGPCPPPGSGDHRYVFTLFAVSSPLGLSAGASAAQVRAAAEGRTIATAVLEGTYRR